MRYFFQTCKQASRQSSATKKTSISKCAHLPSVALSVFSQLKSSAPSPMRLLSCLGSNSQTPNKWHRNHLPAAASQTRAGLSLESASLPQVPGNFPLRSGGVPEPPLVMPGLPSCEPPLSLLSLSLSMTSPEEHVIPALRVTQSTESP